mmetsp:Transcript_41927/g.67869  ORF Transcript_41927/g.67869 Transcript_41927/m.67869 type:complete len:105 (-) Transcript_41927:504-818(-)|eukprot:CAMPEP_0174348848 /NCGR_PEP_ID=MMETSP0811_2-20130205/5460_1 /TAXON_ID=73025 ORGANISM="Eutreptiella gymnastica-like, Strain CCMP1594" /NCGR_SAMPLE_ID=MMETSP0811_2 /ASSEMBLY_ACC=CAM_ASM_000667 /LENGTH=104 /DNA_ID=CAMNT_0015475779 /DNA_START=525 /DNA_END=839 /DNA_ORIENTATION=+
MFTPRSTNPERNAALSFATSTSTSTNHHVVQPQRNIHWEERVSSLLRRRLKVAQPPSPLSTMSPAEYETIDVLVVPAGPVPLPFKPRTLHPAHGAERDAVNNQV